jgi:hypothetical protein
MPLSAEIRWFWPHPVPRELALWFRSAARHGCAAGGGRLRSGHFVVREGQPRWGLRRAGGGTAPLEVLALLDTVPGGCEVGPFNADVELWLSQHAAGPPPLDSAQVELSGRRWMRLFDTGGAEVRELPLDADERPRGGRDWPAAACRVGYAELDLGLGERWVTLALQATGVAETLTDDLRRTAALLTSRGAPALTGAFAASYPAWLQGMRPFWVGSRVIATRPASTSRSSLPCRRSSTPPARTR